MHISLEILYWARQYIILQNKCTVRKSISLEETGLKLVSLEDVKLDTSKSIFKNSI